MTKTWFEHYVDRMNDRYRTHVATKYNPFLTLIADYAAQMKGSTIAEFGCGAANVSRILAERFGGDNFYLLLDVEHDMLDLAYRNMNEAGPDFNIHEHDISQPFPSDVYDIGLIHSHGVLEHFPDEAIRNIIALQRTHTKTLLHYVPSAKYEEPSFGDERLMTPDEWRKICKPEQIIEFNDGYDLALIWNK